MPHKSTFAVGSALLLLACPLLVFANSGTSASAEPYVPTEVVELRDAYSRHFLNRDGSITAEIHAEPINCRDRNGNWVPMTGALHALSGGTDNPDVDTFYPTNASNWTGSVQKVGATYSKSSGIVWAYHQTTFDYRAWAKFDLSTLVPGVDVSSATFRYYVNTLYYSPNVTCRLLTTDPETGGATTIFDECSTGTAVAMTLLHNGGVGWYDRVLNSDGLTAIENGASGGWVAFGLHAISGTYVYYGALAYGHGDPTRKPMLIVDYTLPHDVGVTKIEAPTGLVDSGDVVVPACSVYNFGNQTESYEVRMKIGTLYNGTAPVSAHAPGTRQYITFSPWTAEELGVLTVSCSTELSIDVRNSNDKLVDSVEVRALDVGVASITTPSGVYLLGEQVTPRATWCNYGNANASFRAWMILEDPTDGRAYEQWQDVVALPPGDSVPIDFPNFTLLLEGAWVTKCSTYLAGDIRPNNDILLEDFDVVPAGSQDMGVDAIIAPIGWVDTGEVVTPKGAVKNFGGVNVPFRTWFIMTYPLGGEAYREYIDVDGLEVGAETTITFPDFSVGTTEGTWGTRCSVYAAGDVRPSNDFLTDSFTVGARPPWPAGWEEVPSMPLLPSSKQVKDGGWLTCNLGSGILYAAKGNKTRDFYSFNPLSEVWTPLCSIPDGRDGKPPGKGADGVWDGGRYIYATKGNNTAGFWLYDIDGDSWTQLDDVPPGASGKRVKGGTALEFRRRLLTGYVYMLKGYGCEFYRYEVGAGTWEPLADAPTGARPKWDKGSWLVYDGDQTLFAHKAKYQELWTYDLSCDSWSTTQRAGMPLYGMLGKKKASKDGGSGAWYDDAVYALKGGNTQEFWKYLPEADSWTEKDTIPALGSTGKKKRVKAGGHITSYGGDVFFALKGNKTLEIWRYVLPLALGPQPLRPGVMTGAAAAKHMRIELVPNPLAGRSATLRYSLPRAGPVAVRVHDVAGRTVYERTLLASRAGAIDLDLSSLNAGVYLVRLDADGCTTTAKLVLQR